MNNVTSSHQINYDAPQTSLAGQTAETYFAPAGRDTHAEFRRKAEILERMPLLKNTLNAIPTMVVLLNSKRQIISANQCFLKALSAEIDEITEKRPGEAIGCIRAEDGPDGCGTAPHCRTCGAVNTILDSIQRNEQVIRECRILAKSPSGILPLDLKVAATPFTAREEKFILVVIEDISSLKRIAVLQRVFFHDVMNTAGCILGYADCLACNSGTKTEACQHLHSLSEQLIEEIQYQKDLLHAESGDLKIHPEQFGAVQVLRELQAQYTKHHVAEGHDIVLGKTCETTIITDQHLLQRILGNMIKNALEATAPSNAITLACMDNETTVSFTVHNQGVIPEEIQMQIFQRSFSTKAQFGRGIGTYSMKLLGEQYLKGQVGFASQPSEGTTFWLELPKILEVETETSWDGNTAAL